jgi:uncharacterized repeat protein (TIGR01451 family)
MPATRSLLACLFLFFVNVHNFGPEPATNVTITDVLPAGTTFVSATTASGSCSGTTTVVCTIPALAVGTNARIEIATAWNGDEITNTASVAASENDGNLGNNTDSVTVDALADAPGIPTTSTWGLLVLTLMLTYMAMRRMHP